MQTTLHHAVVKLVGYTLERAGFGVYIKDTETGLTVCTIHNKPYNGNNDVAEIVAKELGEYLATGIEIKNLFDTGKHQMDKTDHG